MTALGSARTTQQAKVPTSMSSMQLKVTGSTGEEQESAFTLLPVELKIHILRFVGPNPRNWKSARLVSTSWSAIVTPMLFGELWLTLATISRLEDRDTLSAVSPHVKHLVLYLDILPQVPYEAWKAQSQRVSSSLSLSRPELETRHKRYFKLYNQQSKLLQTGKEGVRGNLMFRSALAEAIRAFLRLTKVTIGDHSLYPSGRLDGIHPLIEWCPVWKDLQQLGLCGPYNLRSGMAQQSLYTVIPALSRSAVDLSRLNVGHIDMFVWHNVTGFFRYESKASLKNLKIINLDLVYENRFKDRRKSETSAKSLGEFLSAAEGLQELGLFMQERGQFMRPGTAVDVLGHMSLATSSLRKLRLSNFDASGKSLRAFLFNHRVTLRSLELDGITLTDDSRSSWRRGWPGILHMIASSLRLQDVFLCKLADTDEYPSMSFFQPTIPDKNALHRPLVRLEGSPVPREEKIVNGILERRDIEQLCQEMWEAWMKHIGRIEKHQPDQ